MRIKKEIHKISSNHSIYEATAAFLLQTEKRRTDANLSIPNTQHAATKAAAKDLNLNQIVRTILW